jgi:hypothetical protein
VQRTFYDFGLDLLSGPDIKALLFGLEILLDIEIYSLTWVGFADPSVGAIGEQICWRSKRCQMELM